MPRAAVGTPKYLANAMKAKGLQRLRWYCQVCEKQCRDDNGFKCHIATESHLRQMLAVGESAGKHISDFSEQFQSEFVALLSRRFSTNRVKANNVYQEYIQDRHHLHMNSTRWMSLSEFVKHLGRTGVVRVDETDKGFFISWIDNSPKALAKAEANQKKERAVTSDEQRERLLIAEQIERARQAAGADDSENADEGEAGPSNVGLQREEGAAPLKLSFGAPKPKSPSPGEDAAPANESTEADSTETKKSSIAFSTTPSSSSSKPAVQPAMKFNALKGKATSAAPVRTAPMKMNVFKMGSSKTSSAPAPSASNSLPNGNVKRSRDEISAAERLIMEDQERKRRKMGIAN